MYASVSLSPEMWIHIQRLATVDTSPLTIAYSDRFQYVPVADPLKDMQDFLRNACSFVLVSRLWNSLASELLYENIRVDSRFHLLYKALERPGTAHHVCSIRLSAIREDHNSAILALCPRVQILVQPDLSGLIRSTWEVFAASSRFEADRELVLPEFGSLRRLYWAEWLMASRLLHKVIQASPNLELLFVPPSSTQLTKINDRLEFPDLPNLNSLGFPQAQPSMASSLLRIDLRHLNRLQCSVPTVSSADFPLLPSLYTLELHGSRSNIPFSTIFPRCPRLRELCYDVWNRFSRPRDEQPSVSYLRQQSSLSCIRLHSDLSVIRDWGPIEGHLGLFLTPDFAPLQRLVLYGSWHHVVADRRFTRFRDGLRELGCRLEFPEGHLC
ncbi:hypothetical protein DFH09DRAFT_1355932 [Mycena vulgaris]|nr:hypothetical protein DFH09DRAFT_1355932 [Mycena vulgaris]